MTNAELLAKIKAEIERRIKELDEQIVDIYDSKAGLRKDELQKLLSFLSKKPMIPEGLEEELDKWRHVHFNGARDGFSGEYLKRTSQLDLARHIAQWQKEQMLKEAVEADVNIYEDLAAGKSWAEFVVEMPTNNLGDQVRIIIVKEEEK